MARACAEPAPSRAIDRCPPSTPPPLTFWVQPLRVEPSICKRRLRVSGLVATEGQAGQAKLARDTHGGRGRCTTRVRSPAW
ncbi:unnamed protein product [Parnassius apollo]|uniref:(apollo) hypothetical protein n=1 Tax=Parnassius apollo TaxID=110799 RepID=A0A8S3WIM4_PARAO|nr:unnamed protein product [Parnassius apollo]